MAYQLEADPWLISPEYWNGADIMDPNHIIGLPNKPPEPARHFRDFGKGALESCLADVLVSGPFHEKSLSEVGRTEAGIPDLSRGDIVILEKESLSKRIYLSDNRPPLPALDPEAVPIREPYTSYWRQHQATGKKSFGSDQAYFEINGIGITYERFLLWGVVAQSRKGLPMLRTWQFGAPHMENEKIVMPKIVEEAETFPPEINIIKPQQLNVPSRSGGNRSVERVSNVRVVEVPNRRGGTKEVSIEERVKNTLANLKWGVRLQPIPVRI